MFTEIIDELTTKLPAARGVTLSAFDDRIKVAAATRHLIDTWREPVEKLARADMKALQPRVVPELFHIAARAREAYRRANADPKQPQTQEQQGRG